MSDTKITEADEEFEIIEGTPPEDDDKPEADDSDDDDEEDARLAESDEDHDDEISSQSRKRRLKRREVQKRARDNAARELDFLRHQNAEITRRLQAVEGHAISSNEQGIDARLQQTLNDIRQAEHIIARATEAGNGEDAMAAMRIREQAMEEARQLQYNKQQVAQVREQVNQPRPDPRVQSYASEWMQANPWYSPQGRDDDSAVVNAIDASMTAQGYDPTSRGYWEELTNRVAARVSDDDGGAQTSSRRRAPPQGSTREYAPTSTRKEIYVTPERKAAMIEAGVWEDPVARTRMLKAYQAYDKNGSAN